MPLATFRVLAIGSVTAHEPPALFLYVAFPYDTLAGAQGIVQFPYDTVGNQTFRVLFVYNTDPSPGGIVRFPYDSAQPTPTWTSPIRRRSQMT